MKTVLPLARFENLVVQELKDEVLVCDLKSNQVFCLNQSAGEVWKLCDGNNDVKTISQILSQKLKANFTEELVLFSIDELYNRNLLAEKVSTKQLFVGVSRREVIKRVGLGSMVALPLISSVLMPTSAQAQSGLDCFNSSPIGCSCNVSEGCDSKCCQSNVCITADIGGDCPNNSECFSNGQCTSGCCDGTSCVNAGVVPDGGVCNADCECQSSLICCGNGTCCRG